MATIRRRLGKFQARIQRRGFPSLARTFITYREAQQWARQNEVAVEQASLGQSCRRVTVSELLERYLSQVTPFKKGARTERHRLLAWMRSSIAKARAESLRPQALLAWRDRRLSSGAAGATVRNDLNTLSAVYRHASSEWGYQTLVNPVAFLRRPPIGKARARRVSDDEITALKASSSSTHLPVLVDLAVETAMRLSELVNLRWRNIDLNARTAFLPDTKNGHPRVVPLSSIAAERLRRLREIADEDHDGRVFGISPHSVTVAFRRSAARVRRESGHRLGVDIRFHDLRHEAVSRLFEQGLNPIEVAAISGHRSMQMLARYAHLSAAKLVSKLG